MEIQLTGEPNQKVRLSTDGRLVLPYLDQLKAKKVSNAVIVKNE